MKNSRRFYGVYLVDDIDGWIVIQEDYLEIGAYSVWQALYLARQTIKQISSKRGQGFYVKDYWFISKPVGAPKKGAFVMKDRKILSFK